MEIQKNLATGVTYRAWNASDPRALLILVHGLGAHSARWAFLAEYFMERNISSYAIELKGFGETKSRRGHIDSFREYYEDIKSITKTASEGNPGKEVFLIGESMGALIAFLMDSVVKDGYAGFVGISPAFASRMKAPVSQYIAILFSLLYDQKKQFEVPFNAEMCTRDKSYRPAMDNDPREHRLATSRLLLEIILGQRRAAKAAREITLPVLFLLAGEDKLVDPEAARKVFNKISSTDKKIIDYPEMYHALSIDAGRELVFADIFNWITERMNK